MVHVIINVNTGRTTTPRRLFYITEANRCLDASAPRRYDECGSEMSLPSLCIIAENMLGHFSHRLKQAADSRFEANTRISMIIHSALLPRRLTQLR